jgi:hypothetical protein
VASATRALREHIPLGLACEVDVASHTFGNSSTEGGGDMIVTIAKVADFDQFLKTFSTKGAEKRKMA